MSEVGEITLILGQVRSGDQDALRKLIPIVYEELRATGLRATRKPT